MMRTTFITPCIYLTVCVLLFSNCNKLLEIPPPISSITTEEMFASNRQAEWAAAGLYSKMINGNNPTGTEAQTIAHKLFATGLSTLQGGLSSDELTTITDLGNPDYFNQINRLSLNTANRTQEIWYSAYKTIFDANAIIEGITASTSSQLTDSVRKQITGEALTIRAFSYFYLVNFFGELPLTLTSDIKKSIALTRLPVSKIYEQITTDLINARSMMVSDFKFSKNERVRINRWFAEALLARVYLYTGKYQEAINSASAVIGHTSLFSLEQDIANSFLPNSTEAIFQLMPAPIASVFKNGTAEGYILSLKLATENGYDLAYQLNDGLVNAFEPNDKRKTVWTYTDGSKTIATKYTNSTRKEYYTVMRLAELYLIRAEANLLLSSGAKNNSIDDLNVLRRRANLTELDYQLSAEQVTTAIAQERRVELFLEWGHRWFDLKRTGKAHEVLSAISYKQPWSGDYQLLYPIPAAEINQNGRLTQNPEYDFR